MLESNWLDEVLESLNDERVTPCHPVSPQEKQPGDKIVEPETLMNKGSSNSVTPVTRVTPENDKFVKKSADVEETQRERRREKVLKMLEDDPKIQRAFVTDTEADPQHVILTIAVRGVASFELLIPKDRYDGFMLLEIIQKSVVQ